ncbi:MAG: hypothetical protein U5K69_04640 [Balneolaceae bacterium]|nr:hypothetical protein [Balneolaceae bacterium]
MKKSMQILFFAALLMAFSGGVFAQSISITQITPSSPANLSHNEEITIHFDYDIAEPGGARIFIRPVTNGSLSPNYAASGSRVYRRSGSSSANFTITSGNVTVDQLRVRLVSANQGELVFEFFVPVDFGFSSPVTTLPGETNNQVPLHVIPDSLGNNTFSTRTDSIPADAEIIKRTLEPDGTVEIYYTGGYIRGLPPDGGEYLYHRRETPPGRNLCQ